MTTQFGISFSGRQMRTYGSMLRSQEPTLLRTKGFAISPCNFWEDRLPIYMMLCDIGTL